MYMRYADGKPVVLRYGGVIVRADFQTYWPWLIKDQVMYLYPTCNDIPSMYLVG